LTSDTQKAVEILEYAINNIQVAPQSCMKLADIYLELGKYKDTIRIASIGIRATAQDQPTSSIPYFYYVSALAKDALIHDNALNEENAESGFKNENAIKDALMDYQIAYELFSMQRRQDYLQTIQMRRRILGIKSGFNETSSKESVEDTLRSPKLLTSIMEENEDKQSPNKAKSL
jgi:hypothetical protein